MRVRSQQGGKAEQSRIYGLLLGAAVGALVTGLVLPVVVGERTEGSTTTMGAETSDVATGADVATGTGPASDDHGAGLPGVSANELGDGAAQRGAGLQSAGAGEVPGGSTVGGEDGSSEPAGAGSTDVGVDRKRIRLGLLLTDLSNPTGLQIGPGVAVEEQQRQWQALIDERNEAGGIGGRLIEPVFRAATILDKDQMRATCIRLAKDDKVFAVLDAGGAAIGELPQCYTAEHGLPLLAGGAAGLWDESFAKSRGLLFIMHQRGSRMMRSLAGELARTGRLRGQTCGILADEFQGASPKGGEALEVALEREGCDVTRRDTLSADLATGSSQIPVVVQQMRASGVTSVMMLANPVYITQFVQNAESQGYQPHYALTDWLGGVTDFAVQNMPAAFFDRAVGVTSGRIGEKRANRPEIPEAAACRKIYERRTGQPLDRNGQGYNLTLTACSELRLFAMAVDAAGPEPTRTGFASALAGLGSFTPGYQSPGSFTSGKPDLADGVRTVTPAASCRCWIARGEFRQEP